MGAGNKNYKQGLHQVAYSASVLCVSVYVHAVKTLNGLCSCCDVSVLCVSVYVQAVKALHRLFSCCGVSVLCVSVYVQAVKTRRHAVVLVYFVYLCMCSK